LARAGAKRLTFAVVAALPLLSGGGAARGFALVAFNVGVELGQLAIVAVLLPLLCAAGRRRFYPGAVPGTGSLAIACVAALWFVERAFGVPIFSATG